MDACDRVTRCMRKEGSKASTPHASRPLALYSIQAAHQELLEAQHVLGHTLDDRRRAATSVGQPRAGPKDEGSLVVARPLWTRISARVSRKSNPTCSRRTGHPGGPDSGQCPGSCYRAAVHRGWCCSGAARPAGSGHARTGSRMILRKSRRRLSRRPRHPGTGR